MIFSLALNAEFLREIDKKRQRDSRSQFVRDAIYEKLTKEGVKLPSHITEAPQRARMIQQLGSMEQSMRLNEDEGPSAPPKASKPKRYSIPKRKQK